MRLVILLIAVLFWGSAHSEEPSAGNSSGQPKRVVGAQAPIVVNVVPPKKTDVEEARERKEREEQAGRDANLVQFTAALADYTAGLFYATVALVLVTAGLGYFAWRQSRDTKRSTEALMIQTRAAVAAQIPVVAWSGIKLVGCDKDGNVIGDYSKGPIPEYCQAVMTIINTGPTNILTTFYAIKWEVAKDVSKEPHFGGMWPVNTVLVEKMDTHSRCGN